MSFVRLLTAALAVSLLGLVGVSTTAADAAPAAPSARTSTAAPAARATQRKVFAKVVRINGKLTMKGYVTPPKGPVIISKATSCNRKTGVCNFKKYATAKVRDKHYRAVIATPRRGNWYWQARVGSSKSDIWVTCRTTSGSCAKR